MSIATKTTYLAKCDYPDCHMAYDFWASSTERVIDDITEGSPMGRCGYERR